MNKGCFYTTIRFLIFVTSLLTDQVCYGLIPKICADQAAQSNPECCPPVAGFEGPCGGPTRGECRETEPVIVAQPFEDERQRWPRNLFSRLCVCKGRFSGVACETCQFGWTGTNCDVRTNFVRKNIESYSASELKLFLDVLKLSREVESDYYIYKEEGQNLVDSEGESLNRQLTFKPASVQEALVFIHAYASPSRCETSSGGADFAHGGEAFMLWHRAFMLLWEREFRKISRKYFGIQNFAFPYWDWTNKQQCTICQSWLIGAPAEETERGARINSGNFLRDWKELCSSFGAQDKCVVCHDEISPVPILTRQFPPDVQFPTLHDVNYALSMAKYDDPEDSTRNYPCLSFHQALEGTCAETDGYKRGAMHNYVHNVVNGTFRSTYTSPNDPLFIFHHIQLDRLLSRWYRQAPRDITDFPEAPKSVGHCRECYLIGFLPLVKTREMYVDCKDLGYDYDNFNFG